MSKKVLAACVAALSLAACEKQKSPSTSEVKAVAIKVSPRPAAAPSPAPAIIPDAGSLAQVEPAQSEPDPLGTSHQDRGNVDHLGRALAMKTEGDVSGALAEARRALFDDPSSEEALALTARLSRQAGQKTLAQAAWARLGELRPDDAVPLIAEARVRIALGDFAGAVSVGSGAIIRDGQNPEAFQVIGLAHLSAGELREAIDHFEKVIALSPDHGWAQNNLGFALLRANENARAVQVLGRAAELLPHVAMVHNNRGVALERTGRIEEAKLAYALSTSLSPKYVKAKVNSARVASAIISPEEEPMAPEVDLIGE